jgi:hypothetical protein
MSINLGDEEVIARAWLQSQKKIVIILNMHEVKNEWVNITYESYGA